MIQKCLEVNSSQTEQKTLFHKKLKLIFFFTASIAHFSAVCWLYGKALNEELGYPIGLVGTNYGGTPVEAWSSPQALQKCGVPKTETRYVKGETCWEKKH